MLRKKALNRILITTTIFFLVFIIGTIKELDKKEVKEEKKQKNEYEVYTINDNDYVSKTSVYVNKELTKEEIIKEKLEIIIKENNKNALLPSYFNPIIPQNTKIKSVEIEDNIVKLNFSEELLNINEDMSEKMIESIIYTITDDEIIGIEIYVEGNIIKYVPNTKKELPSLLTKEYGINKVYNIHQMTNIKKVMLTYYKKDKDIYYEIPITKYINSDKNKLDIIMEELNQIANGTNLLTMIDNIKITDYKIENKTMTININKELEKNEKKVLKNTIFNNFDIKNLVIKVNNSKKIEKYKKNIEK